jgi:hypothetical protein
VREPYPLEASASASLARFLTGAALKCHYLSVMVAAANTPRTLRFAQVLLGIGFAGLVSCGRTYTVGKYGSGDVPGAGGAGEDGGATAGAAAGNPAFDQPPQGAPLYTRVQRLTNSQFEHAAIDILGLPKTTDLASGLVSPISVTTFTNNEWNLSMDERTTLAFEEAAEKAAALATSSPEALARLYAGTDAAGFVRELGRRAFRRPVSDDEVARYTGIFARGEELYGAGFAQGAALVIRAMLQSPSFLYRTELGPVGEPLTGYEIASKLSFWLLDTTPSDALLDAAAAGELDEPDALVARARSMLAEPPAKAVMRDFHGQLYRMESYDQLVKNVPAWNAAIAPEAKEASFRFFDRIFESKLGVRDILTSTRGFVGPSLAPLYSQEVPNALEERELGPQRVGYFMQIPWLMLTGINSEPATIHRGLTLLFTVLCADDLMAPDSFTVPSLGSGHTNRETLSAATDECGGACHKDLINPLGFAFEGFDGMGLPRDTDNGQPVDTSGSFEFSDGRSSFADARELMTKLAEDDRVYGCYGQNLASYGLQRALAADDIALIDELAATGRRGTVQDIALALVRSAAFRVRNKDLP